MIILHFQGKELSIYHLVLLSYNCKLGINPLIWVELLPIYLRELGVESGPKFLYRAAEKYPKHQNGTSKRSMLIVGRK